MVAYQLSIFAENKPGSLGKITSILGKSSINIRAITISTSGEVGVFNVLVDKPKEARKALENEGLKISLKAVIAVLIEDKPGSLDKLVQLISSEGINIENAYGFVIESWKRAVFVVDVDQIEKSMALIEAAGYETLDAEALLEVEPFHYMKY